LALDIKEKKETQWKIDSHWVLLMKIR
jgi:hypothetical protein